MENLKLVALDSEDIGIISAHLQDAVVKSADVHWRPSEKRLVIALNRFDWEAAHQASPEFLRRRAVLRFDRVSACKCRNCTAAAKDQILNLLAVSFEETDQPAGVITLTFSGGAALRLEVECLEAELADLGPVWGTGCCPTHPVDGELAESSQSPPEAASKQG